MRALPRPRLLLWCLPVVAASLWAGAACGPTVDCELLCQRTLACEVTFDAPDDPNGSLIDAGDRTDLESCTLGCQASELVTVESATCVDGLDTNDPFVCQGDVLECLGID